MTVFVALLRAVNVGGTGKLPMADLKQMCERAGFKAVRTYIASGNVVHKSMAEAERYCKAADQKIMVDRAIARTTTYPPTNQSYPQGKKA
jgi:uncharacterized protein (DUF1697 family)